VTRVSLVSKAAPTGRRRRDLPIPAGIPVVYSYLLDSASGQYRDGEVFTGLVKATVPFPVEIDLSKPW
jgi:hypothetical protein